MSAHHVVAVDAVCGVLHAVVDLSPEHGQVLSEPAGRGERGQVQTGTFSDVHRTTTVPADHISNQPGL